MRAPTFRAVAAAAVLAATAVFISPSSARAADASAWNGGPNSSVRLIAGGVEGSAARILRAGVEIRLQPGWKTYWRYPGDSGVPPRFDFSHSENVKHVTVLWPAPVRFSDGAGASIGYTAGMIFPLRVEPTDPNAPVRLSMKLDYGVCEKLCVPVDATATLPLSTGASAHDGALAQAEARVPKRAALGADGALAITAMKLQGGERPRVIVDIRTDSQEVDLFAEGPTADWALPLPEAMADAPPGIRRFSFELDGLPSGATAQGAKLTLTAVTPQDAIEVVAHLD